MNPDETQPDRQLDLKSPPQPPAEIIDIRVGGEMSSEPEPLQDAWAHDETPTPESPLEPTAPASATETQSTPIDDDRWSVLLDEIGQDLDSEVEFDSDSQKNRRRDSLLRSEAEIKAEIANLQATQAHLQQQILTTQQSFGQIVQSAIDDLERQRQKLQISVEQLERRRDRIQAEINKSFAGASQDVAIRIQGFKDYLVGSLQDLVAIAEEIEFPQPPPAQIRIQKPLPTAPTATAAPAPKNQPPQFAEPAFKATANKVRGAIDRYRRTPDYYAPTWQLRRTLEAVHADKVSDWFFNKDGRGAVKASGSRLQNVLVAAAAVSVLRELYGDYLRTFVLANLPERLGDWRRGFQDCLGLSKTDFGGNGGIILFEDPYALIQKVDRVVANREMPLIIIDNSEGQVSLSILQYPLWLAFAPDLDRAASALPSRQVDDYR